MKPISPTIPGTDVPETIFGADQPQYQPLPAIRCDDDERTVVSRWRLTWKERLRVLWTGNVWLSLMTFGHPIQPSLITTECPVMVKARRV